MNHPKTCFAVTRHNIIIPLILKKVEDFDADSYIYGFEIDEPAPTEYQKLHHKNFFSGFIVPKSESLTDVSSHVFLTEMAAILNIKKKLTNELEITSDKLTMIKSEIKELELLQLKCGKATASNTILSIKADDRLFSDYCHCVSMLDLGECKLVAIHGRDKSTEEQYKNNPDSTLVSLVSIETKEQIKMLVKNTLVFSNKTSSASLALSLMDSDTHKHWAIDEVIAFVAFKTGTPINTLTKELEQFV
ncbi:hypothetical protein [Psychromonas sp. SP041]|uniref:hypothetical protein n=1 Tax=Psychromonas sp. SP041 TaxID=1365007 RepID=UPI0004051457|nr:hypothetical protein [Psychromonas sp. SP041]